MNENPPPDKIKTPENNNEWKLIQKNIYISSTNFLREYTDVYLINL